MPEYTFYKIVSKDENIKELYVGKTTNFKRRVQRHKSSCYNENSEEYYCKLYQYIRENGGINNWNFIEIETNEYNDKESALKEKELIKKLNATLNIVIPTRTLKEWYEEYYKNNKEKIKEYCKNNKEIIKEYQKKYYEKNREIIKEYQNEYCKNNKEIIKEKAKEYREKNKEYLKEKRKEKIICECSCEIRKSDISRHLKTQKHINLMS
jgi:hypothetical protein